jgi:hypothetical protein
MRKKKTNEQFVKEAEELHSGKYDYSLVEYKGALTKIKIICPTHGVFEQTPNSHIQGSGCIKCRNNNLLYSLEEFIKKAKEVHGEKYDYSLVEYNDCKIKIKIVCPAHGVFEQTPDSHIRGAGCPSCSGNKKLTTKEFIKKAKEVHGEKYDYSLTDYKGVDNIIKIVCPIHGIFEQTPYKHVRRKQGCAVCKFSHGEREIYNILKNNNIKFIHQYRFKNCKFKNPLPFDFYLPEDNICIEFQGIQHFKKIDFWGGENMLKKQKEHDKIKENYCIENNIKLIKINYNDNIEECMYSNLSFTCS